LREHVCFFSIQLLGALLTFSELRTKGGSEALSVSSSFFLFNLCRQVFLCLRQRIRGLSLSFSRRNLVMRSVGSYVGLLLFFYFTPFFLKK
jgi:hypothetical protein